MSTLENRSRQSSGVDVMGGTEFIVSATHQDKDIDETVVAFEEVLIALRREAII